MESKFSYDDVLTVFERVNLAERNYRSLTCFFRLLLLASQT